MKLTKQQLKQIIKEEVVVLMENEALADIAGSRKIAADTGDPNGCGPGQVSVEPIVDKDGKIVQFNVLSTARNWPNAACALAAATKAAEEVEVAVEKLGLAAKTMYLDHPGVGGDLHLELGQRPGQWGYRVVIGEESQAMEESMKLTKQQLKQIIKEELSSGGNLPEGTQRVIRKISPEELANYRIERVQPSGNIRVWSGSGLTGLYKSSDTTEGAYEYVSGDVDWLSSTQIEDMLTKKRLHRIIKEELIGVLTEITGFKPTSEMEVMKHYQELLDALDDMGRSEWVDVLSRLRPELERDLDVEAQDAERAEKEYEEDVFTNAPRNYASMQEAVGKDVDKAIDDLLNQARAMAPAAKDVVDKRNEVISLLGRAWSMAQVAGNRKAREKVNSATNSLSRDYPALFGDNESVKESLPVVTQSRQQLEQIIREELRINEIEDFTRPGPGWGGHPRTQEEYEIQAVKGAVVKAARAQEFPQELNGMEDAIKSRIDRAWKFVGKLEVPADVEDEVNLLRRARDILSARDDGKDQAKRVEAATQAPAQEPSWGLPTPEDAGPAWALARFYLILSKTSEEV